MARGVVVAVMVTLLWMAVHLLAMQFRPASNRFRSMLCGYLCSLPLVWLAYCYFPAPAMLARWSAGEAWLMGCLHAYLLHLLLFFLFAECFYHVERSVTLRILLEIQDGPEGGAPLASLRETYRTEDMIARRLESLEQHGFVRQADGRWRLRPKGERFARAMQLSSWVFQSQSQTDRRS